MLRIAITAWIAGGSSFLFLPELPEQGLGVSIAICAIFAMLAYQFRKSHQTAHLFLIVLTFYFFGWSHHFYFASERLARSFPSSLENQEIKVQGYVDQLPSGNTESQRFKIGRAHV